MVRWQPEEQVRPRRPEILTCVEAAHLHRHRGHARRTQHQDRDHCRDGERRLHGDRTRLATAPAGYTLVFKARLMMLVSALTMESPVSQ